MEYVISNADIQAIISPIGAELQSLVKEDVEYLWDGTAKYWPERAPILFPFVGRLTDGKYILNGKKQEMSIHGFARKLPFTVIKQEQKSITFELKDSEETYSSYPYHFSLIVEYTIKKGGIEILYRVKNQSEQTMYFGIGGHPGFKVPLEEGLSFSDYYLEFGGNCCPDRIGHTKTCFLSGENTKVILKENRLKMHHKMFDDDAIVFQNMADSVTLKSDNGKRKVTVSYPNMPYLGLWHTPKTEAPYICIEPWSSLPSRQGVVEEFQYKCDLIRLKVEGTYENKWSIAIE